LLDVVIRGFKNGGTPESIVDGSSILELADVCAVIAYYLRHHKDVDAYLQARREDAEKLQQEIEAQHPRRSDLRAKLLARRAQMELEHASFGK
jgi:predicted RNase H-like nuclease (RuvC/YqgF family)